MRRHDSAHLHRNIKHIEPEGPPGRSARLSRGQRSQQEEAESAFGLFPLLNEFRQHLITNHTLLLEKQKQINQSLMQDWLQNQVEGGETKTSSEGTKLLMEPVRRSDKVSPSIQTDQLREDRKSEYVSQFRGSTTPSIRDIEPCSPVYLSVLWTGEQCDSADCLPVLTLVFPGTTLAIRSQRSAVPLGNCCRASSSSFCWF